MMAYRESSDSDGAGTLVLNLFLIAFYLIFFIVYYIPNWAPHTYPTDHTNFWFGLVHGVFAFPTFLYSLFNGDVTIYQAPNDGNWYNFGFVLGAGILLGKARRRRSRL